LGWFRLERVGELRQLSLWLRLLFACQLVLALLLPASLCVCVRVCGPTMTSHPPRTRPLLLFLGTSLLQRYWELFGSLWRWQRVRTYHLRNVRGSAGCARVARLRGRAASSRALERYTDEPISLAGQALVDLYTATNGAKWLSNANWLNGDPCSQKWYGVRCSGGTIYAVYVYSFYTRDNHSPPPLPQYATYQSITIDTHALDRLHRELFNNRLIGSIPSSIGSLVNIEVLYVNPTDDTHKSGSILINHNRYSFSRLLLLLLMITIEQIHRHQSTERHHSIIDWLSRESSVLVRSIHKDILKYSFSNHNHERH